MNQTGRADMLRALARGASAEMVIDDDGVSRWVYARKPGLAEDAAGVDIRQPLTPADELKVPAVTKAPPPAATRLPLRMLSAWEMELLSGTADAEERIDAATPLPLADLEPSSTEPVPYQDLVPWARVLPGLRRHSDIHVAAGIHWQRLMDHLARRELPRRWPQRQIPRWPEPLVLVLDVSERLAPYRHDFHTLAQRIHAIVPDSNLSVRVLARGPANAWQPWRHARRPTPAVPPHLRHGPHSWRVPAGATVVVAGDLGALDPAADSTLCDQWLEWARILKGRGARLIALAPLSPASLPAELLATFTVLRWSTNSRWLRELRPVAGEVGSMGSTTAPTAESAPAIDTMATLLALGATALRIDPPLLRAWCRLLSPGGDASLEGRFWNHPDVQQHAMSCSVRPDRLDHHLAAYAQLPQALRQASHAALHADHAHLRGSLNLAESWRHATASSGQADAEPRAALTGLLRTARSLSSLSEADRQLLLQAARLIQSTAVERVRALDPDLFAALDVLLDQGMNAAQAPDVVPGEWQWRLHGDTLVLQPSAVGMGGQIMATPFLPGAARTVSMRVGGRVRSWSLTRQGLVLPLDNGLQSDVELAVGKHRWHLSQLRTPPWVEEVWVQAGAVFHAHTAPSGQRVAWAGDTDPAQVVVPSRLYMGADDYGLYVDLTLAGLIPTSFRLRYIRPGGFLMGSPEGVGHDDERPQHLVTLTEGYWLADTPCTQSLWQAVMGDNPSQFKEGPEADACPVENVSWDDVQIFLQNLRKLLPQGCEPTLPTEAQWEYAARAGTGTVFWWGDSTGHARANWGKEQRRTTPVRRFEPNPWGLYDVHGNVDEWCLDDRREYTLDLARDPHGDLESAERAVRGGSWFDHPVDARSAYRYRWHRDGRSLSRGFRMCLRSPGPVPAGAVPRQGGGTGGPSKKADRPNASDALVKRLAGGLSDALGGLFGRKGGKKST